jgi:hypothetical protein
MNGRPAMARGQTAEQSTTNPLAFYIAKDGKRENLAAASSRVFLGVQLECAQCHDHPTSKWTRDQFWSTAAFFGGIERNNGALRELPDRRELAIPGANRAVQATFLDEREPEWKYRQSPRVAFAEWVVAKENPFFAKAGVNRLWGALFGAGIVDPIDNFDDKNPPSHPELLNELAKAFVDAKFDVKFILRAICLSEAFQRSSAIAPSHADVRLFARFPVQSLSPEQLFQSLSTVIGPPPPRKKDGKEPPIQVQEFFTRNAFQETFSLTGAKTESQTTILQALTLMNGREVAAATAVKNSATMKAVMAAKEKDRIELMYFTVLNRKPTTAETERIKKYLGIDHGAVLYADVLWVLLNSLEFRTIH